MALPVSPLNESLPVVAALASIRERQGRLAMDAGDTAAATAGKRAALLLSEKALQTPSAAELTLELAGRIAAQRLVAEHEMGELFKVIGLARGITLDPIGFARGDRTHTL